MPTHIINASRFENKLKKQHRSLCLVSCGFPRTRNAHLYNNNNMYNIMHTEPEALIRRRRHSSCAQPPPPPPPGRLKLTSRVLPSTTTAHRQLPLAERWTRKLAISDFFLFTFCAFNLKIHTGIKCVNRYCTQDPVVAIVSGPCFNPTKFAWLTDLSVWYAPWNRRGHTPFWFPWTLQVHSNIAYY